MSSQHSNTVVGHTPEQRIGKRAEQKRLADEKLRRPCAECGEVLVWRGKRLCVPCYKAEQNALRSARRKRIQEFWLAGLSLKEIAAKLESTVNSIGTEITLARRDGWDIPFRHKGIYEERALGRNDA